jgi:hypothetical protein
MALIPQIPGLDVRAVADAGELLAARQLHARCYLEAGYIEREHLTDGLIDDPWVPYSDTVIAVDTEQDEIVGTARIIKPSVRGFPAFEFFEPLPEAMSIFAKLDPNRCSEISALSTPRNGLQNMAISAALYAYVWQESVMNQRAYMLAIMDDRLLRIMRRWFDFPFEAIGLPAHWMGARTTPVALYIPRALEVLKHNNPEAVSFFSGGIPFADLDLVSLDIRENVAEHRAEVLDLRSERAPFA